MSKPYEDYMLECARLSEINDELLGALKAFVTIDDADRGREVLLSNQGQSMDGYTKLANYENCVRNARKVIEMAGGKE